MNMHAHISTQARDCDGLVTQFHVATMSEAELAGKDQPNWFGEIEFHNRVTASMVNTYSIEGTGTLEVSKDTDGSTRLSWRETTDEGFKTAEAVICTDEACDTEEKSYRDHAAEAAGY